MATKKKISSTQTPSEVTENASMTDAPTKVNNNASTSAILSQLTQQFNLLLILFVALFLFQIFTYYKIKRLETNGVTAAGANVAGAQQVATPLSIDNLKAYAKELKLDTNKFNKCLDSGEKAEAVKTDADLGASLNVQGTPGFFINGKFLGGAFPVEMFKEIIDKEIAGTGSTVCTDYSEQLQQFCSDPNNQAFKPEPQEVAMGNSQVKGNKEAKVTIIEFSDFECPFCIRAYPTVQEILKTYPNDVKFVYKHLPLTNLHPNAQKAAEASVCAQDQGKFWEYHDKLFSLGQ